MARTLIPVVEPDIVLYTLATPNGMKVSVLLEELGIPYSVRVIDIRKKDQFTPEFVAINPNSKIPAITDKKGPKGKPVCVFESGAIMLYLAEKYGRFISADPEERLETIQWLFWQMAGVGPMFGQFGHFTVYAPEKIEYPIQRYTAEVKRLLAVLENRLEGREYIVGSSISIADIAVFPWIYTLSAFYKAEEKIGLDEYKNVVAWFRRCSERPAAQKGMAVAPFPKMD